MCKLYTILFVVQNFFLISPALTQENISGRDNTAWLATDTIHIQIANDSLVQYLADIDLSYDSITAITLDGEGRIWIGSNDGLWVFDGKVDREYSYKDGLFDKNILYLFCSNEGYIWAATSTGPFALLDNHFYVFEPLKNIKILAISENATSWLFLTENGLRVFKKEKSFLENYYVRLAGLILLFSALSIFIYWAINYFKTNVEWKANLIRVEQEALLAQMNPHFIFNSLNSVQRYILSNDKESAHTFLQKFASMMRKFLESSSQSTTTLSEEISTLELYLQLENLRFDNGFDFEITVKDDDIWQLEIPAMLLQTFVENAVWHGLMNKESRGKIELRFSKMNKKFILCEIEDNGIGRKKAAEYKSKGRIRHKSKGTEIVKKRIKLLNLKARHKITCKTIDLEEENAQQSGTLVRLEIPVALG
jgi:two-component sensor histidine kinase